MMNATEASPGRNLYLVEYYTKNPTTGEGGWEIKFAWVFGKDRATAYRKVACLRLYDETITMTEQARIVPLSGCSSRHVSILR